MKSHDVQIRAKREIYSDCCSFVRWIYLYSNLLRFLARWGLANAVSVASLSVEGGSAPRFCSTRNAKLEVCSSPR